MPPKVSVHYSQCAGAPAPVFVAGEAGLDESVRLVRRARLGKGCRSHSDAGLGRRRQLGCDALGSMSLHFYLMSDGGFMPQSYSCLDKEPDLERYRGHA
jgi:hypothetical protein